jgi:predicted secreted hydrolase
MPFYAASLIQADGRSRALSPDEFSLLPLAFRDSQRRQVPVRWQVSVPTAGIELEVTAWPGDFWNPGRLSYWEGPVDVSGSHGGEGYLEMTGYGD